MRTFGAFLMIGGALAALIAFTVDTSLPTYGSSLGLPERAVNLGLLQSQMMILHTGLAMFIAGAVLVASPQAEPTTYRSSEPVEDREVRFEEEDKRDQRLWFWLMFSGLGATALIIALLALGAF